MEHDYRVHVGKEAGMVGARTKERFTPGCYPLAYQERSFFLSLTSIHINCVLTP